MLVLSALALGQSGSIAGTVTDVSGAVVQGAEVTATNTGTNASRTATTSDTGSFSLTDLTVGTYQITVKQTSFKTFRLGAVELSVAQVLTVNPKLEAGATSEEVQVTADKAAIELDSTQISNLVDQRQMVSLPLITRNPYQLVLLSPGTSQTDNSAGGFSVNGARGRNNNFLLDGVDNNDTSVPGGQGGVLTANPDSTEEFRVITDNFNAEFGRNTGAIIDVITKSGSNALHGGAYYFGRWNGFGGARDYFNPGTGPNAGPMNPYIRNQFGFSVGGPIIKNKTFFFFNDEMDRFRTSLTNQATVPTQAFLNGQFNYTYTNDLGATTTVPVDLTPGGANNGTSANNGGGPSLGLDPTIARVLATYPVVAPSQSANGISGNVFFPSTSVQSSYTPTIKIDHKINDRESLNLRYGYNHVFDPDGSHSDILPGGIGAIASKSISEGLSAQLTSTLTNNLLNNFQFGWNHIYATFYLGTTTTNALDAPGGVDSFGNGWDYALNPFTSFGSTTLGGSNGQNRKTGTVSYTDSLTWVRGSHTMKFGGDFRNVTESGFDNFSSRRQITLDPEATFDFDPGNLINAPSDNSDAANRDLVDASDAYWGYVIQDAQQQFFNKTGSRVGTDDKVFKQHELDFFAQDSWKIRPNLTLSFGLRYQYNGVPYETSGNLSNLLRGTQLLCPGRTGHFQRGGAGSGHQLYDPDYKDIEPRFGFSSGARGKTVRRQSAEALVFFMIGRSGTHLETSAPILRFRHPFPASLLTL